MAIHQTPQNNASAPVTEENGSADAFAATLIITVVVAAASFWLHGMA